MTTEVKPTQDAIPPVLMVFANSRLTTAQQRDCEIAVRGLLDGAESEINQHTVIALSDFLEMLYQAETGDTLLAYLCHARNRLTIEMTELPDSEQEALRARYPFLTYSDLPEAFHSIPRTPEAEQPERNGIERVTQWFEQYKTEVKRDGFKTGGYLLNILSERARAKDPQDFERAMVAIAIATLLESKETPEPLCREIADAVLELHSKVNIFDVLSPENIREQLPMVLERLADDEQDDDAPANEPTPETDTYTPADDIAVKLAELLEMNLPSDASNKVDDIIFAYQQARKTNKQEVAVSE